jgi:three-Cys-motif partner protein
LAVSKSKGWGRWSQIKLDILSEYLDGFTTASKGQSKIVYLDLFAGDPRRNFARGTGEPMVGSPHRALAIANARFTHLRFCELTGPAAELKADLEHSFPGDVRYEVIPGDSNATIHPTLAALRADDAGWAPTFAFVDPDGPDCHWTTLQALAAHKGPDTAVGTRFKVEFWFLFATMLNRMLPLDPTKEARPADEDQITAVYGTDQWRLIYEMRKAGKINGAQARAEYVNLMRWRIEKVLGYRQTHPLDVPNEDGRAIYTMILATDHPIGAEIMTSIYSNNAGRFPAMVLEAQRRKWRQRHEAEGQFNLFEALEMPDPFNEAVDPRSFPVAPYEYVPPWEPPGTVT